MSDSPRKDTIATPAEFETALGKLLAAAEANDIDIGGSWVYDDSTTSTDLEVLVYELET
jgi:hypothetical protein